MRVVYALGNSGMVVKISEAVPALSVILDGEREFRVRFALADWMEDVNNLIPAIVSKWGERVIVNNPCLGDTDLYIQVIHHEPENLKGHLQM